MNVNACIVLGLNDQIRLK